MQKKLIHKLALSFALLSSSLSAQMLSFDERDIEKIGRLREYSPSPEVRHALEEERFFRTATKKEIQDLLDQLFVLWEERTLQATDINQLKIRVLNRLHRDLAFITQINKDFSSRKGGVNITWSCKTNKMAEVIPAAILLFREHSNEILGGVLPEEFKGYWDRPRSLINSPNYIEQHNLRDLAFKASLLVTLLELKSASVLSQMVNHAWMEESPTTHSTPLPGDYFIPELHQLSFFYNGTRSPRQGELAFVHGGYAFGGQREDSSYFHLGPFGKLLGPQDCSSWLSKIMDASEGLSTVDFYAYHINLLDHASPHYQQLQQFQPVAVRSIYDVHPGMYVLTRRFNLDADPHKNATLGVSGHAWMVIDVEPDTNTMLTVEYGRDLPSKEGFGVARREFNAPLDTCVVYFQARKDTQKESKDEL